MLLWIVFRCQCGRLGTFSRSGLAKSKYKFDDPKAAFAEAEKRIQQALESGAKKLVLTEPGLEELPESILQLDQLLEFGIYISRLSFERFRNPLANYVNSKASPSFSA